MKPNIRQLKTSEISSDVFVIAPNQIDLIAKLFGDAVAEEMNVRSLSQKIQKIATETLIKVLNSAKTLVESK